MPTFELLLEGPAVPLRAAKKNAKRYQKWIGTVKEAAQKEWPSTNPPVDSDVVVTITNIFTDEPPDVDNIIKPLLDALCKVVYTDDRQVVRVTNQKFDKGNPTLSEQIAPLLLDQITPILAAGLESYTEVIYITVVWE